MNPLLWKREHRQALLLAVAVGAAFGLVHGVSISPPIWNTDSCVELLGVLLHPVCNMQPLSAWFPVVGWPVFGGVLSGVVIVVWRLMQR